jgi:inner membrane protein
VRHSTTARLVAMAVLILGLLLPMTWVYATVSERASRRDEATSDVSTTWGGMQVIGGPVLMVPYVYTVVDTEGRRTQTTGFARLLPRVVAVEAKLQPERRQRGIFDVVVYRGQFIVRGRFVHESFDWLRPAAERIDWSEAVLSVGISDPRGLSRGATLTWNGQEEPFAAGITSVGLFQTGIQARVPMQSAPAGSETPFEFSLAVNGTRGVRFLPAAAETTVTIASSWPHPSFIGSPLPDERQTSDAGFDATWRVPDLGRGYPARWMGSEISWDELAKRATASAFGVDLIQPVDIYLQAERAVKYAVLFFTLTFVVFFLWEVMGKTLLHPVQYAFVGFALCVFYLLLVSLSEHAGFDTAYGSASTATTLLIGGYGRAVLGGTRQAGSVVGSLAGLYGYLYMLLRLEDYALLAGSVGLFLVLATLMFVTRRMNWYELSLGPRAS